MTFWVIHQQPYTNTSNTSHVRLAVFYNNQQLLEVSFWTLENTNTAFHLSNTSTKLLSRPKEWRFWSAQKRGIKTTWCIHNCELWYFIKIMDWYIWVYDQFRNILGFTGRVKINQWHYHEWYNLWRMEKSNSDTIHLTLTGWFEEKCVIGSLKVKAVYIFSWESEFFSP